MSCFNNSDLVSLRMDHENSKSIVSELIALSQIDGQVTEDEAGLIKKIGNMLGLTDHEILDLFKNPATFKPQTSALDRLVQFHGLVLLMNVDGDIHQEEIVHLRWMGIKLGLNPAAVNEILRQMSNYPNNVIPPDELIAIYKKYLN